VAVFILGNPSELRVLDLSNIEGYKSNSYARRYGIKFLPDLYDRYNPITTSRDAEYIENVR
tara:strand:- start:870 stop:1052 length:183 start_codon:yes stop_codon:yes gene_type:complete